MKSIMAAEGESSSLRHCRELLALPGIGPRFGSGEGAPCADDDTATEDDHEGMCVQTEKSAVIAATEAVTAVASGDLSMIGKLANFMGHNGVTIYSGGFLNLGVEGASYLKSQLDGLVSGVGSHIGSVLDAVIFPAMSAFLMSKGAGDKISLAGVAWDAIDADITLVAEGGIKLIGASLGGGVFIGSILASVECYARTGITLATPAAVTIVGGEDGAGKGVELRQSTDNYLQVTSEVIHGQCHTGGLFLEAKKNHILRCQDLPGGIDMNRNDLKKLEIYAAGSTCDQSTSNIVLEDKKIALTAGKSSITMEDTKITLKIGKSTITMSENDILVESTGSGGVVVQSSDKNYAAIGGSKASGGVALKSDSRISSTGGEHKNHPEYDSYLDCAKWIADFQSADIGAGALTIQ